MSLTPGTLLGSFEISVLIGVGGMGEVYRATDTNLKRQVAIKVLPWKRHSCEIFYSNTVTSFDSTPGLICGGTLLRIRPP